MHTTVGLDDVTHGAGLQSIGCLLERPLHLSAPKEAQISALGVRGAIRVGGGQLSELLWRAGDLSLETFENFDGLFL